MKRPGKLLLLVVGITLVMAAWGAVSVLPSGAQGAAKCEPEQAGSEIPALGSQESHHRGRSGNAALRHAVAR